ncbi:MAG: 3'-5' exonuclease, partial [Candidatus Micrarchaeota archaeon]
MPLEKKKLFLFDADFVQRLNSDGKSGPGVRLIFKDENGKTVRAFDSSFEPYFYVLPSPGGIAEAKKRCETVKAMPRWGAASAAGAANAASAARASSAVKAKRIEEARILVNGEKTAVLRVVCEHPSQVPALREAFAASGAGRVFEADIPFVRRYLYDKAIYPSSWVETEIDGETREIKSVRNAPGAEQGADPKLRLLAFDIEVRNPRGVTDAKRDECTMI